MTKLNKMISILAMSAVPAWAIAAGDHDTHGTVNGSSAAAPSHDMSGEHNDTHESMAGMAGDAAKVSRTIPVEMNDNMRFTPANLSVKAGETVRFFIVNKGRIPHEMVIGTVEEIDEHASMMKNMPDMAHKEANQITLAPGQRGGIVWQFAKAGAVTYACLVPGHKEAGMVGTINVN
tara:strand:- start:494 stop:1024 length:531 start_codon:yes stop_codon:yes gene_type:complete